MSHTIRQWISYDSHNADIGKEFRSRIRVIAGQRLKDDLRVLSLAGSPKATTANIEVGSLVGYQTEEFYVIGIDGNNVKLLSRYLINVGEHPNPNVPEGLQSAELGCTRTSIDEGSLVECYLYDPFYIYGTVPFSGDRYWWDFENGTYLSPYSQNSFVYNNQASISNYVNTYADTLMTMGLNVTDATIMSLQDFGDLCEIDVSSGNCQIYDFDSCPNYIYETTYWVDGNKWSVESISHCLWLVILRYIW